MFDNIDTGFKKPMAAPSVNEARTVHYDWGCLLFMSRQEVTGYDHIVESNDDELYLWELTKDQYQRARSRVLSNGIPIFNANAPREHVIILKRALEAGKPVPDDIIDFYKARYYWGDAK